MSSPTHTIVAATASLAEEYTLLPSLIDRAPGSDPNLCVARIAYSRENQVDIEPIHYIYQDGWLYGRTSRGAKLELTGDSCIGSGSNLSCGER